MAALLEAEVSPTDVATIYEHFPIGQRLRRHDPATRQAYLSGIVEAVTRRRTEREDPPNLDTVLVRVVVDLVASTGTWQGTPTKLLEALAGKIHQPPLGWPSSASVLSKALKRLARRLAKAGVEMCSGKEPGGGRQRQVTVRHKAP